jgi:hypothetical protein
MNDEMISNILTCIVVKMMVMMRGCRHRVLCCHEIFKYTRNVASVTYTKVIPYHSEGRYVTWIPQAVRCTTSSARSNWKLDLHVHIG